MKKTEVLNSLTYINTALEYDFELFQDNKEIEESLENILYQIEESKVSKEKISNFFVREGMSIGDIAELLEVSTEAVENKLRQEISKGC